MACRHLRRSRETLIATSGPRSRAVPRASPDGGEQPTGPRSLAFALRGDFPWKRVPGYIIIQLIGAALACLFLLAVFGSIQHLGATLPGPG